MSGSQVSFSLIGPGRAGRSLLEALHGSDWQCQNTYKRGDNVAMAAQGVDVLILTVPDDAIAAVANSVHPVGNTAVLHLSGAKTLEVLAPHPRRGSVHPLVSLPDPATGAARLVDNAAFAVAGDPVGRSLVETLGGRWFVVDDEQRALYHATAAIASNHLVALCAQVYRLAERLEISPDLYTELMAKTLENVRRVGPLEALTGPAARGDLATVNDHTEALSELDEHEVALYSLFAAEATRLGERARRAEPASDGQDRWPSG